MRIAYVMTRHQLNEWVYEVRRDHPEWSFQRQLAEVMKRSKGSVNPRLALELLCAPHHCVGQALLGKSRP